MLEQLILKQILLFSLEAKYNKLDNSLKKVSIAIAIERIKSEILWEQTY